MVRFQCIHCGGRIAVHERYMDRLACCPDCGGVTHPLAEHLVKSADASSTDSVAAADAVACDNCGEPLGKLQKPFEWDGHQVCGPCFHTLSMEKTGQAAEPVKVEVLAKITEPAVPITPAPASPTPVVVVDAPRPALRPPDYIVALRAACLGLCATAAALYVVVTVLSSIGGFVIWGAAVVAVVAAIYWVRRGVIAVRRRMEYRRDPNETRQVRAIVRE